MRRRGMAALVVLGLVGAGGGFALGTEGGAGGTREPVLTPTADAAATRACGEYSVETEEFRTGAGLEDLVRQAEGIRDAREQLTRELLADAASPEDRKMIEPLNEALAVGNELLTEAADAARADDVEAAYDALGRWQDGLRQEQVLAAAVRLDGCGG